MKKKLIVFLVVFLFFVPSFVFADNRIYFDSSNMSFQKGKTYDIDIKVESDSDFSEVNFNVITTSNYIKFANMKLNSEFENKADSGYSLIASNKQKTGTVVGTLTISIDEKASTGSLGIVKIVDSSIVTDKKNKVDIEELDINIEEKKSSNYLSSLKSEIAPFTFDKNTFSYEVEVDSNIENFDLVAIAEDSDALVNISSQKLDKRKNIITVKVTKEGLEDKTYKITVLKKIDRDTSAIKDTSNKDKKIKKGIKNKWICIIISLVIALIVDMFFVKKIK